MESVLLQFQGARDSGLLAWLLAAVVMVLLTVGVWRLGRRQWSSGVLCLSAALGPAGPAVVLFIIAAARRRAGANGTAKALLGGFSILAATAGAGAFYIFSGRSTQALWLAALGLQVAIAVGIFYNSVYAYLGTRRMAILMAMRCLAILSLLLILFKPALSFTSGFGGDKPFLPIVIDRSGSMSATDEAALGERYSQALWQLNYQRDRIEKSFRPLYSHFGSSFQMAPSLEALTLLKPTGQGSDQTNLATAIRSAASQFDLAQSPGILIITDGLHNGPDNLQHAVVESARPIFVAGIGSTEAASAGRCNIAISAIDAPLEVVKNNISTIAVRAQGTSLPLGPLECQLYEEGSEQPIARQSSSLDPKTGQASFELKYLATDKSTGATAPAKAGEESGSGDLRRLRVAVTAVSGEATEEDNAAPLHVLASEPRIRVLYVEGTMRSEYKHLKRLLESDPNVQFMGLVQVRPREFMCQGSINGVRLSTLPSSEQDFALFDVIILGDLDRTYLTNDQLSRFAAFANRGGGLLMLGGHNSFGPGGYGETALEEVLPVSMGPRTIGQEFTQFVPQLTAQGQTHPIFEGISGFFGGPANGAPDKSLPPLPDLMGCVNVLAPKPSATVLALHPSRRNQAGPLVVLAVQSYGGGRSAAFTADTTHQWNMPLKALGKDSPYSRFWGQMVRYLANTDTKSRSASTQVLLRLDRTYLQAGQTMNVLAKVRDARPASSGSYSVTCTVLPDDPKFRSQEVTLSAGREQGAFAGIYQPTEPGKYRVKVIAVDSHGLTLGIDELHVTVAPHQSEMDRLGRDVQTLQMIGQTSSGMYADISRLPELVDEIIHRQASRSGGPQQAQDVPLYNFTILFLLFAGLITVEWLLRRNWQLH